MSAFTAHTWTTLTATGAEDVRVKTSNSVNDPVRPTEVAVVIL